MWLIAVATAAAYEVNIADWSGQDAPVDEQFELNAASFAPIASATDIEAVYQRAIAIWNAESGADLYVEYGGTTTTTAIGGGDDGHNVDVFGGSTISATLARSTWGYVDDDLTDCDTEFYTANGYGPIEWYVGTGSAGVGAYDLQQTMTHELGHCLGLGHSTVDGAIMGPYNTDGTGEELRHLTADDRAGIQSIYGVVAPNLVAADAIADDVGIDVPIRNDGDGSAFFVTGSVDGPGLDAPVALDLGDIGARTPVGLRVGPDVVDALFAWSPDACTDPAPLFAITLADRIGNTWSADVAAPIPCTPAESANPAGCACDSGSSGSGWAIAALAAIALRRRQPMTLTRFHASPSSAARSASPIRRA